MRRVGFIILIILMSVSFASCQLAANNAAQLGREAQPGQEQPVSGQNAVVHEAVDGDFKASHESAGQAADIPAEAGTDTAPSDAAEQTSAPSETAGTTPSPKPTTTPSASPTPSPTAQPTPSPTAQPTPSTTAAPTYTPTPTEMPMPTPEPTPEPTEAPVNTASKERYMVRKVNEAREAQGLPALAVSSALRSNARAHSEDMADNNFFSHTSPTRGTFAARVNASGIGYSSAGENIAYNSSVGSAHSQLMGSSGHRANILNADYTHIGIGIEWDESEGVFYITQWFAQMG